MCSQQKQIMTLSLLMLFLAALSYLIFFRPVVFFTPPANGVIDSIKVSGHQAHQPSELKLAQWQQQTLPDDWSQSTKKAKQYWYRHDLELLQLPRQTMAVYLPKICQNVAVYINGIWVGQSGSFKTPIARNHNLPQLFAFSSKLLTLGSNHIHFKVAAATPTQGLIDRIYFAPYQDLVSAYRYKKRIRVDLIIWLTGAMLVMAVVLAGIWCYRRHDFIYAIFAMALFFWSVHNLNLFIVEIPMSSQHWQALNMLTLGWTIALMPIFGHHYLGQPRPKTDRFLCLYCVAGLLLFLATNNQQLFFYGYLVWYSFLIFFGLYATHFLVSMYLRQANNDAFYILLACTTMLVCGLHDILVVNRLWSRFDGLIIQYSAIPTVIIFSWFLIRRFINSLNTAERLSKNLHQQVRQKQQQLESQYESLYLTQKKLVLLQERERMMRDMHDGIGGQLVALASFFNQRNDDFFIQAQQKIRGCINDLHMVIDSLDPLMNNLPTLLGTMRLRWAEQLKSANITLDWHISDLPESADFSSQHSLHIMRTLQEVITNAIKHSGTTTITVATGIDDPQHVFIKITDYGQGLGNIHSGGRGFKNMAWRMSQINGSLKMSSSDQGTEICLILQQIPVQG